ncbi:uncharacterized protein NPIL_355261 [Nephila pilipes]|uniref:Uncharacterized protein n=1 Tax=Nephila pilipes TaxID=299642 RepID=A0A8X6UR16_NEPPI|nr:uncharacterized protein NPIL_355261 [Nephila pilipes]
MNVPSALHFGGLWKAAMKSMKFHMGRVIGSQILPEEFFTSLAEIGAALNSRLLDAASDDPNDFSVITPVISLAVQNKRVFLNPIIPMRKFRFWNGGN